MQFTASASIAHRTNADILIVPFWEGTRHPQPAASIGKLEELSASLVKTGDFTGKLEQVVIVYPEKLKEKRLLLIGLGKKKDISIEILRRTYAAALKASRGIKAKSLNLVIPSTSLTPADTATGVAEGLLLANYVFEKGKGKGFEKSVLVQKTCVITGSKSVLAVCKRAALTAEGVYLARDLVNGNADDVTPQFLVSTARSIARRFPKVKTTIFSKQRLVKEKFGLILAVNQGSHRDPALIVASYKGDPKAKEHTVVVGKGITYDTGGLSMKSATGMLTMRCDMGGAATALGTLYSAARLGLKTNLTIVVATTENAVGTRAYKPGDVYTSYSGKTVEIMNTDAEGRLVLADALAYSVKKLKPTRVIDFATLTGAMAMCFGCEATGVFSNNDSLYKKLEKAGNKSYERLWRLPVFDEYAGLVKSEIADLKNSGYRMAPLICSAMFLKEFVGNVPWAHCDIAGTAFISADIGYRPKNATGVGVRLMTEFLSA